MIEPFEQSPKIGQPPFDGWLTRFNEKLFRILTGMEFRPNLHAYRTTNQSIPDITPTAIIWEATEFNVDKMLNLSVNPTRLTVPVGASGKYGGLGVVTFVSSVAGNFRAVELHKNGTKIKTLMQAAPISGGFDTVVAFVIPLTSLIAGDYLEVLVSQNSGGALNVVGSQADTFLGIHRIL